jgi:hypothetical protein
MSKDKIYVVTMYRWGDRSSHSYVLGAYTKKNLAIEEANKESENRGEKYLPEVIELNPNETYHPLGTPKYIYPLEPSKLMVKSL